MSIGLMQAAFNLVIPSTDKFVLVALANHAHHDGTGAYPSVARLARQTSFSERCVQKALRRLEKASLIVPIGSVQGGRGDTVEYKIILDNPQKGERRSSFQRSKGRTWRQKWVKHGAKKGEPGSPESSLTVLEPAADAAVASVGGAFGPAAARERASSGYDHPPLRQDLTSDDGVPRFLSPANGKFKSKNAARENAIKGEAQSILEKRGFDSSFVTQAIELIHKRVRTVPATAQYYVAAFDREGPESMATLLKIAFIHEVVENAAESGRRASDVLLDRLQSGRESRENLRASLSERIDRTLPRRNEPDPHYFAQHQERVGVTVDGT